MKKTWLMLFCCMVLATSSAHATLDGIWKDAPQQAEETQISLYIQTTTEGSMLVVLLDMSELLGPPRFLIFLDPDYSDGVEAAEMGGSGLTLTMTNFVGEESADATLSLDVMELSFPVFKWFQAPDPATEYMNGIFKDQPLGEASDFSVFVQTYYGVEPRSALAVLTADGGGSYYAFLDPDIDDGGFEADDLFESGAHLSLEVYEVTIQGEMTAQAVGVTDGEYSFTAPEGDPVSGDLYQWFSAPNEFSLSSPAFSNGNLIPVKYTADGDGVSPPLTWADAPPGTESYVVLIEDLTASDFLHWLVYDLSADTLSLEEGADQDPPGPAKQGVNSASAQGYAPMDPPVQSGVHQYFFRVYALDETALDITGTPTRSVVENAMQGHILGEASFFGTYVRN